MSAQNTPLRDREWTRGDWVAVADRTLKAVQPYATTGHGLIHIPGVQSRSGAVSDGLEGFARTFLAAAFRIAGAPQEAESGRLAEWYAAGVIAGTTPGSADQWPTLDDVHQARVEAASIAIALHETRTLIWDHLTPLQQAHVVEWFSGAVDVEYPGNNWVWFQNIVQAFLKSVGAPTCERDIERNLARVEEWYSGDGWYTDGAFAPGEHRSYDHYSGWAMQFYPVWWSRMLGADADHVRTQTYRSRLRSWLDQAQHLIGFDGAPLYHGRSLTYRFAVLAPFWAGVITDATPLSSGRTRRIASRMLSYFDRHGAFGDDGVQPIGWHSEFVPIRQWYSGSGSPYWSSKGFAGLVLPAEHPVWSTPEEPLASELSDVEVTLRTPGWIVSTTRSDGIVRMVNHGGDHHTSAVLAIDESIYGRFAYTTVTAPDSGLAAEASPTDSTAALVDQSGRASHRRPFERLGVDGRVGLSRHRAHWLIGPARDTWQHEADGRPDHFEVGPWMTVASVLHGAVEVRVVRVDFDLNPDTGPADPGGGRAPVQVGPWRLQIGGHPLAGLQVLESSCTDATEPGVHTQATVRQDLGAVASVTALRGAWTARAHATSGANAMGLHTSVPTLVSANSVADHDIMAAAVVITASELERVVRLPEVMLHEDAKGCAVEVLWPDGERDEFRLDPPDFVRELN